MTVRRSVVVALAVALAGVASPGRAAHLTESGFAGARLLIKNNPSANRLILKAKDAGVNTGRTRSTGDPTCEGVGGGGGAIRVNGGPGNDVTIDLPCEGWTHVNKDPFEAAFLYRDRTNATCSKVLVRHGKQVKAICRGPQVAYTLGAPQGDIDVTIRMGTLPVRICTTLGPPPTRVARDGSNGKTYKAKDSPLPPLPCASSPSAAFLD